MNKHTITIQIKKLKKVIPISINNVSISDDVISSIALYLNLNLQEDILSNITNKYKFIYSTTKYHNIPSEIIMDIFYKLNKYANLSNKFISNFVKLLTPKIIYQVNTTTDKQYICWLIKTRLMIYDILVKLNIDGFSTSKDGEINIRQNNLLRNSTVKDLSKLDEFDYECLYSGFTGHSSYYSITSVEEYEELFSRFNMIQFIFNLIILLKKKDNNLNVSSTISLRDNVKDSTSTVNKLFTIFEELSALERRQQAPLSSL